MLPGDTIAAIATARGTAALAMVRVSGPDAIKYADACLPGVRLEAAESHTAHFGRFSAESGSEVDQVVATVFRSPRSSTGEDVVEISCHGGDLASRLVLQGLLNAGARLAGPGEFTQRAFLNGKIDLAQAEAVAELIHASSSLAHRVSVAHLEGRYSENLQALRSRLLEVCSLVELELDFGDEDVAFADAAQLEELLNQARETLRRLLDTVRLGTLIRDGVRVAIIGRPNAGKSTLLNAVVAHDRAIVSEQPGTTRDEVDVEVEVEGVRIRFVDTAGLRLASDEIEVEGVRRARRSADRADIVIYLFDLSAGLEDEERSWIDERSREPGAPSVILVGNKADLVGDGSIAPSSIVGDVLRLSARAALRDERELTELLDVVLARVSGELSSQDVSQVVTSERHRRHLKSASVAVERALQAMARGASGDQLSMDLRLALHELGCITGEITNEDVLDQIFSRFCIGK
jgi:tRNA modification GTPase